MMTGSMLFLLLLVAYAIDLQAPFLLGGGITLGAAIVFAKPVLSGLANTDDL